MENFLFDAVVLLSKAGVDFVICGGIACVLQGSDRNSFDLDLSLSMDDENLKRFVALAKQENWKPRIPEPIENLFNPQIRESWIRDKEARVFTVNSSDNLLQIDIFLTYPIPYEELKTQADIFEIDGITFVVSSIEHLLKAKRVIEEKRRNDWFDIEILEELLARKPGGGGI